jgi:hypothetical protein
MLIGGIKTLNRTSESEGINGLTRRGFLAAAAASPTLVASVQDAIPEPHLPSRVHLFVWRNWELCSTSRMAQLLGTSSRTVLAAGYSMGLPRKVEPSTEVVRRSYITVIRQNWHVLPENQLRELLGWDANKLAFTLKEDDFLGIKLGPKPRCEELRFRPFTSQEREGAARIRQIVRQTMGSLEKPGEPAFDFVRQLSARAQTVVVDPHTRSNWNPRYLYSYFALYGDPLLEPDIDPFPDGYLEKLASHGNNGVWMQGVLNQLAPSTQFREFGAGWQIRLENLRRMVARAGRFGIRIYMYLNEPRSMPAEFFESHPEVRGCPGGSGFWAMCTSTPKVREWLRGALAHIVKEVPQLGGFFTITMSENQTNCFSHGGAWGTGTPVARDCPRCSKRTGHETIGELLQTFRDGIRASSATAELINWDWGWGDTLARNLIPLLPRDSAFLSISEWEQPVHRGGVDTRVGEYSISVTGPGPRATRNWKLAANRGLKVCAKVQLNNTWEISAVPYIPVLDLVAEHCEGLQRAGIEGLMASWTCGGYPSPNLEVAQAYAAGPQSREEVLQRIAKARYGPIAGPQIRVAWKIFSEAFREFPYGVAIYTIPTQHGPANLLRLDPTGVKASMILFPQDDLKAWCGAYPAAAVHAQFTRMAQIWKQGLERFRAAPSNVAVSSDIAIAETCGNHFQSVANQVEFYMLRGRSDSRPRMHAIAEAELEIARSQYRWARQNSTIAFEASNHYYYRPLDLVEKILNCRWMLDRLG